MQTKQNEKKNPVHTCVHCTTINRRQKMNNFLIVSNDSRMFAEVDSMQMPTTKKHDSRKKTNATVLTFRNESFSNFPRKYRWILSFILLNFRYNGRRCNFWLRTTNQTGRTKCTCNRKTKPVNNLRCNFCETAQDRPTDKQTNDEKQQICINPIKIKPQPESPF